MRENNKKTNHYLVNNEMEQDISSNDLEPNIQSMEDQNNDLSKKVDNKILRDNLNNLENKSKDFEVNLNTLKNEDLSDDYSYDTSDNDIEDNNAETYNIQVNNHIGNKKDFGILLLLLSILGLVGFFFNDIVLYIGLIISIISFIGGVMLIKRSSLYSKIALTISFIAIIMYTIMLMLGFRFFNNNLDSQNAQLFKKDAETFISSVEQIINENAMLICNSKNVQRAKMYLGNIDNLPKVSPLNKEYDVNESYVLVETEEIGGSCVYRYYVFLKDENYSLGTYVKPILREDIEKSNVKKNSIYK